MPEDKKNQDSRIETRLEVQTYLDRLKYALNSNAATINFQEERNVDCGRKPEYTNHFTVAELFPEEEPVEALKRELVFLKTDEYIETVKDRRYLKRDEMRVFGRYYEEKEIYIKIRVELLRDSGAGVDNYIFVMSFHHSTVAFKNVQFPYK